MSASQIITGIIFLALTGCNLKQPEESTEAKLKDTLQTQTFFNKNEKVYLVQKIGRDTIDPNGNKCNVVEMKNAEGEIFESFYQEGHHVEIGDSVWIGYGASGEAYIVRSNKNVK